MLLVVTLPAVQAQLVPTLEPLYRIQTKAFDIYAPRSLGPQALRLSTLADETYAELLDFFGVNAAKFRIPVLLTDYENALNGFTTLYPSNRIVIFLAAADPRSQLATLDDELRSVFLHELVHYVTLNEKTAFWKLASWIGGDWLAPEVWMMPQAIVEGTAVWIESRLKNHKQDDMQTETGELSGGEAGRLNDPAALEYVRLERSKNISRNLWDVSGLKDFYGSGNLPYLYGGLFVDYLSVRFGPDIVSTLWKESASGNVFQGFDGTLTSDGILERCTGVTAESVWKDFQTWLDVGLGQTSDDGSVALFEGYVGALGAGGGEVFFVDLEKRGVYTLNVGEEGVRERLFAADGNLRNIFFNVKFQSLDIDWIRTTPDNRQIPARYTYDFNSTKLQLAYDLPIPEPGKALCTSNFDSNTDFFIYDSWRDIETDTVYGLMRCGSAVPPARRLSDGRIEIAEIGDSALRWISPGYRRVNANGSTSIQFALQIIPEKGLSRLALLEDVDGAWRLRVEKSAPPWGVSEPIFLDEGHIVYRGSNANGRSSLRLFNLASFDASERSISWISLSDWINSHPIDSVDYPLTAESNNVASLFPLAFATSRFPYVTASRIGFGIDASDITERLSWSFFGGWDMLAQRPAAAAMLRLATGAWQLGVSVSDQAIPTTLIARRSSLGALVAWHRTLVPVYRVLSTNLFAACAGVRNNYTLHDVFNFSFDYATYSAGLSVEYASLFNTRDPPYTERGFSSSARIEYEVASDVGFGGVALSGSASLKAFISASVYGAFAPFGGIAFSPGIRFLEHAGNFHISAADLPYPEYSEYRDYNALSNWYLFGEVGARLFDFEIDSVLRLPFLPSLGLRRVIGSVGLRTAGLEIAGSIGALGSVFAKLSADTAVLAGLGGATHTRVSLEAAWAFQPSYAAGYPLHISLGIQTTLQ